MDSGLLEWLARLRGIGDAYHDYRGELRYFSLDTKRGILRAMGCPLDDDAAVRAAAEQIESASSRQFLPALLTLRGPRALIELNFSARQFGATFIWSVALEEGVRHSGTISSGDCREVWRGEVAGSWITRREFEIPIELPPGNHNLELKMGGEVWRCLLIAAPAQCYEPAAMTGGRRLWGVAVQLYTMRSRDNWGIGDFHDLRLMIQWAAARGAGFVGLNPLHALAPADPGRASPYSASSRHFLNVLYIAVPQVAEFAECQAVQERLRDDSVQQQLAALRAREHVDYVSVAQLKFEMLDLMFQAFLTQHVVPGTLRGRQFRAFVRAGGELLQTQARFDALDRHFQMTRGSAPGWLNWPSQYHDVHGPAAALFAQEHAAQVEYFAYLQWLAREQLSGAQALACELGMPIGLYGDYAVGANPGGSETWAERASFALAAEIGAPPDPLALKGQGWGIPPQDPAALLAERLQGFAVLIRNNMRSYGALRLDHVMSLFRLWWVPAGFSPIDGAYVHYPLQQLLTVLSLESARAACLVVGEDLGVVPDEMRQAMPEFGLYHYKVLLFEKLDGRFRRPEEYVQRALATVTTHDMPTLRSYWEGLDIELRRRLNLYPSAALEQEVLQERNRDREALLRALDEQGLRPPTIDNPQSPFTAELAEALHLYLARSASRLVAIQIEDLLGMVDPVNVPGTHLEYPNWQRKLSQDIEDIAERDDLRLHLQRIDLARAG